MTRLDNCSPKSLLFPPYKSCLFETVFLRVDRTMDAERDIEVVLGDLRGYFNSGKTRSITWRQSQLKGLLKLLNDKEEDIFKALYQDLGKPHIEAFKDEVGILLKSANYALKNLKHWMAPKTELDKHHFEVIAPLGLKLEKVLQSKSQMILMINGLPGARIDKLLSLIARRLVQQFEKEKKIPIPLLAFPASAQMVSDPLGLVLIFSSWNFPIGLSLEPLIGAIAAGNTVVLKPSDLAPACSSLLATLIPIYLDKEAIKIIEGGVAVAERLLDNKWDKIFFTGSPRVGRAVMVAAAKHLTPVTLELGGKCPAVVDSLMSSRDRKICVKRILGGKFGSCYGQACIAIDYILVEEKYSHILVESIKVAIKEMFGENPRSTNSRIGSKQNFLRLKSLLEDEAVKSSIVYGGSLDAENLFIEPTVLLDPPLKADIMKEEIFGPLLPVITLKNIEDSISFINSRPKPLVLYVFTNDEKLKKRMTSETSSGSLTFNDSSIQYLIDTFPFGGVGESGFGRYHGKYSFETFSHEKPILRRNYLADFWFRYPPWNTYKYDLIRSALSFNYLLLVLVMLGLKKY